MTCASEEGHTAVVELLLKCPAIDINLPTEVHIPTMNVFPTGELLLETHTYCLGEENCSYAGFKQRKGSTNSKVTAGMPWH